MGDRRMTNEQVAAALTALGPELDYPPTPSLRNAVLVRLETERAIGARPVLPRRALWSRRRMFAIGSIEIRVQPGGTPSASLPPVTPRALGDPVPAEEAVALAGFEPSLPSGPPPDEVYVIDSPFGDPGLLYAWRPSATYPALPGTEWGLVLLTLQGDEETVVKDVQAFEDVHDASVGGARGAWIPVPHTLTVETEDGTETFSVQGNVLIWEVDGVTYRLETSLDRASALEIARSVG